jgi:hypothetical protein
MDCKSCGRKRCTMANVAEQLCQVCYNYTPDKSCQGMLDDFMSLGNLNNNIPKPNIPKPENSSSQKQQQ